MFLNIMNSQIGWFSIISALREIQDELIRFEWLDEGVAIEVFWKELYSERVQEIRELVVKVLDASNIGLNSTSNGEQFIFPVVNRFHLQDLVSETWITPASIFTIFMALTH